MPPHRDFEGYFGEQPRRALDLSPAQLETIRYLSHGLTAQMIADVRVCNIETVKTLSQQARHKLAAKNTAHAVAIALRAHLID